MIRKNLLLLEYMVIKRIEKDTVRLDAIRSISKLLFKANMDLDKIIKKNKIALLKDLVAIKGKPLGYAETELIEEIFKSNEKK
ncbi:MAG: hypothetical protein L3J09_10465 [Flavobacteriaceae bacterium]|nr:hypothetical protein [Flavobacteriaceae bacterium]